jgi:uncharacterized membrane protein
VRAVFGACLAFVYLMNSVGMSSDHSLCRAMMNNVLLAYIPVEMSLHVSPARKAPVFWGLVAVWTIFYPNAPYVRTDYFHLAYVDPYAISANGRPTRILRPDLHMWLTFTILSVSAIVSALFGTWSLDRVVDALLARFRRRGIGWRVSLVSLFVALSSAGIYLGRFPRLNSVDLLTRPHHALGKMTAVCNLNMIEFVAMLSVIQLVLWGCLRLVRVRAP